MKSGLLIAAAFLIYCLPHTARAQAAVAAPVFVENKGQWPLDVLYLARLRGLNAWITKTGVTYDYYKITRPVQGNGPRTGAAARNGRIEGQVVAIGLVGGNKAPEAAGTDRQAGDCNFFKGNDRSQWGLQARRYTGVYLKDIYPGIDQRWYFDNGSLRYDFVLRPGADAGSIGMRVQGADRIALNRKGEPVFTTRFGEVRQRGLYAYQMTGGKAVQVACAFKLAGPDIMGLSVKGADASLPLVIDPFIYSTFLGGSGEEYTGAHTLAADAVGNTYISGTSASPDYPVTTGSYNASNLGTSVFITKINPGGNNIVYSTFIYYGYMNGLAVDTAGNAYITGSTYYNWPTTPGAYNVNTSGSVNNYVTKLSPTGSALVYSTLIGAGEASAIALDAAGNAYTTGSAQGSYPTTPGAFQGVSRVDDAYVTKLNASGSALVYSTLLGGTGADAGRGIAVDSLGNAYVAGSTTSNNFPVTPGAYKVTSIGAGIFVTKINSAGTALVYSTFLGGSSGSQEAVGIAADRTGHAYVGGYTNAADFPVTANAYQRVPGGGYDAFITRLSPSGAALDYSTYLGGPYFDLSGDIAIDTGGNAFITGRTNRTAGYPLTADAFRAAAPRPDFDIFLTGVNSTGSSLLYSTLLGGSGDEYTPGIAVDKAGTVYIAGTTNSPDLFRTPQAIDTVFAGPTGSATSELFIVKFGFTPCSIPPFANATGTSSLCPGDTLRLNVSGGYKYSWRGPQSILSDIGDTTSIAFVPNYGGDFIATVIAANGCIDRDTVHVQFNPQPAPMITRTGLVLRTDTFSVYQWYVNGQPIAGATSRSLTMTQNGTYYVVVKGAGGCSGQSQPFVLNNLSVGLWTTAGIRIFPNPTNGPLEIVAPMAVRSQLRDIEGRTVVVGGNKLDMGHLAKGLYFLSLTDAAGRILLTRKVVLQ